LERDSKFKGSKEGELQQNESCEQTIRARVSCLLWSVISLAGMENLVNNLARRVLMEIGVCEELEEECERIYWRTWDGGGGLANFTDKCVFVG
jgi:hypothetical protein